MTNEEAKMFLDNLKRCIDEHPIVADWLVEIADRKTEPTIEHTETNVETMSCQECKHFNENAVMYLDQCEFCFKECHYEPKTEPQTEDAYAYDEDDWYDKTEREGE